jgi:hypothetical protein
VGIPQNLTTFGVLLRNVTTDGSGYAFGDIIDFSFKAFIRGSTLPGIIRNERASYVVTVESGGLTHEVGRGDLDVRLGSEQSVTFPIHHVNYSRGSNGIKVQLSGAGYSCSHSIYRTID